MASIWKHPKTGNWQARFRDAAGRKANRTTGTTDKAEAQRIADSYQLEAGEERARLSKETKAGVSRAGISDVINRAYQSALQGKLDAAAAWAIVNELLRAAGQEEIAVVSNRQFCDQWRHGHEMDEKSHAKYEQVLRDWLDHLGKKAESPLESAGKAEAIGFRDKLRESGLSARTVGQYVKLVRGVYQHAVEDRSIGRNPFAGVKVRGSRRSSREGSRLPFSASEVAALIRKAEGEWKGLIILAATSGLRLMDASRLQWRDLDLEAGTLCVVTRKKDVEVHLPLHAHFAGWLRTQTRGIGAAPVFPSLAEKGGTGKSGLSMAFRKIMEAAEVSRGVVTAAKGKGRATGQKSFHSLRHFAATQLAQAGVRAEIARAITGHQDAKSHAGYITPDMEALRSAVSGITLSA